MSPWNWFSPEAKDARFEAALKTALETKNHARAESAFCDLFRFRLRENRIQLLSDLVVRFAHQMENTSFLSRGISPKDLSDAIDHLEYHDYVDAALMLCNHIGEHRKAIEVLARRGRANDLASYFKQLGNLVDRELLTAAVDSWEAHNGDIRASVTMSGQLIAIARFAPESIPHNSHVKELIGQFEEAAELYVMEGNPSSAATCYENAGLYSEARARYLELGDGEGVSRMAEALGDLDQALQYAERPNRRLDLLIRLQKFRDALRFAGSLESSDECIRYVKEEAKKAMPSQIERNEFIAALEFADIAEAERAERDRIVQLGLKHTDSMMAAAKSDEELRTAVRNKIELLEKAERYEEAGILAENELADLDRAILLYEKANLFDRAIEKASESAEAQTDSDTTNIRLARLHEKGGNLIQAARCYEVAGRYDKAAELYEDIGNHVKAAQCYCKTAAPRRDVLVRLYAAAGEFEKLVELTMESEDLAELERGLSIAEAHHMPAHIRKIKEKVAKLTSATEKDLPRWFAVARDDVLGSYAPVIGIDFGTTNSVAALFNTQRKKVEIVPTARGIEQEPSYFGLDEHNHLIFGEDARLRALTAPDCVVARVKRSLGEKAWYVVKGKRYRSEEIVAGFLQHLRANTASYIESGIEKRFRDLLNREGLRVPETAVRAFLSKQTGYVRLNDIVLSVPAYFNDHQKKATRNAAEIAGLTVRRLLAEPTAAALAYSHHNGNYSGELAVIDLGGGTLDISIVDITERVVEVEAVSGDTRLGGSDIDAALLQHVIKDIKERLGIEINENTHSVETARLRDACENVKINLSFVTEYSMELVHFLGKPKYVFTISRTELERIAQPVLDRAEATVEKAIKNHKSTIGHFLLVGNATKMPAFNALMKKVFSVQTRQLAGIDPGVVVATGAVLEGAILVGELKETLVLDVVPYGLGIAVVKKEANGEEEEITWLIEKNATIPITRSTICTTKVDNQPNVNIRVYQGEAKQPHLNYFLGNFVLDGIQPAPAHTPQIDVTFDIGADCILQVTAVDKGTGNQQSIKIERAVGLSPSEKDDLRNRFAQLEQIRPLEEDLARVRQAMNAAARSCEASLDTAVRTIRVFSEQFHDRVEINGRFYDATRDQAEAIQVMFRQKDQLELDMRRYTDQFNAALYNAKHVEGKHLDFSDRDIASRLKERVDALTVVRQAIESIEASVRRELIESVEHWIWVLNSLSPKRDQMNRFDMARYEMSTGRLVEAKAILESIAEYEDGLSEDAFRLLLKCYARLGLRKEYRDAHKRYGALFGWGYPEPLSDYVKAVADSVFVIQAAKAYGSGFCAAPGLIVTNHHVVEGSAPHQIKVISEEAAFTVSKVERILNEDLVLLTVNPTLKPFRLGENSLLEPGEPIVAIGFPHYPASGRPSEDIYVSTGTVNAIKRVSYSSERVIYGSARIGPGMSGGPLVNDLGEAIGIVTMVFDQGFFEVQPVALPIQLVVRHLERG